VEHSTKYSHMSFVSRWIHTRQCCCTLCTTSGCNCHTVTHNAAERIGPTTILFWCRLFCNLLVCCFGGYSYSTLRWFASRY